MSHIFRRRAVLSQPAQTEGISFPGRMSRQVCLLITKSVVHLTVIFCVLKALAGDRAARLHCQQCTGGTRANI